jgi:hypothetical protein
VRRLTVIVAAGCQLCPAAICAAEEVAAEAGEEVALEVIDIDGDVVLERRWRAMIPVVLLDGREIGRYTITAGEMRAALRDA